MSKERTESRIIKCLSIVAIISFIIMMISIINCYKTKRIDFIKPDFDTSAIIGNVEITEELKELEYIEFYQDGMSYKFSLCGKPTVNNKQIVVYFTNHTENITWLKLRILDENSDILGESGIIKPGEYIKYIDINKEAKSGDKLILKVMGYTPEKYTSAGSVSVNTYVK